MKYKITQAALKETLVYSPETGIFTWLITKTNYVKVGDVAGNVHSSGYRRIMINGAEHPAHRLAWLYVTGSFPPNQIDHINGVRDDNRIQNLRAVTNQENNKNKKRSTRNKSGIMGVSWDKRTHKWLSQINNGEKGIYLGQFDTIEEAATARQLADIKYNYHANHGR